MIRKAYVSGNRSQSTGLMPSLPGKHALQAVLHSSIGNNSSSAVKTRELLLLRTQHLQHKRPLAAAVLKL
jgi:hypothetical protein